MRKAIFFLFNILLFSTPLIFITKTSEVFEFNKMVLTYIFTILIAGVWTTRMVMEKRFIFRRTILDIPLIAFLLSQVVSTLVSIDPRTSIFGYYSRFHGGLLSTLSYTTLYWAFVSNINKDEVYKVIKVMLASALVIAVYGILEHFGFSPSCLFINGKFNAGCWVQDVQTRVFATLGQPNWMGAFLVSLIPLTWILAKTTKFKNILWYVASGVLFTALLFTKSRSALLGFIFSSAVFWGYSLYSYFENNGKSFKERLRSAFAFNFVLVTLIALFGTPWTPSLGSLIGKPGQNEILLQGPALETGGTESGDIRKIVWEGAIKVWQNYPIFGSGPETFAFVYPQARPLAHNLVSEWDFVYNKAHNEFLNIAATSGSIGILAYLSLIGATIFVFVKRIKSDKISLALLAGYISILVTNFFGFSVVVTGQLFWLFPAITLVTQEGKSRQKDYFKNINDSQKILASIILLTCLYLLFTTVRYWYADLLFAEGRVKKNEGLLLEAAKSLRGAIEISPHEALYHRELSEVYSSAAVVLKEEGNQSYSEMVEAARGQSDKAVSLSPRNLGVLRSRANIFSELATIDSKYLLETNKVYMDLLALSPTDAGTVYRLALNYGRLGELQKAIETIEIAIEMKPNYKEARYAAHILYKETGEIHKAKAQLEYILENIDSKDLKIREELQKL